MGGFNLGQLSGILTLDDSQFKQKIADSAAASALMKIEVDKIGTSIKELSNQLKTAGFNLTESQRFLNQFRLSGLNTKDAVDEFVKSIRRMQDAIRDNKSYEFKIPFNEPKGLQSPSTVAAAAARGDVTQPFAAQWANLQKDLAFASSQIKKQLEADGVGRQKEVFGQVQSEITERLRVEKEVNASRQRIEQNAKGRAAEMQAQMVGDVQAQLRIEQERANAVLRVQKDAQARERAQFFEHRRQMQVAQAATTIGVTAGAVGAAGLGAGLFVAKDAAQFQDAMAKSLAVIGDVSKQVKAEISQTARDAAKETGLAAKDIADNFAIAAKGGLDVAQSMKFIPQAAKFAIATNSELHESTRQLITIMEALQIPSGSAAKVMDELTVANQLARGSVDNLATMLEGKAGAALRSAKVSLEEALAMTVAFSKAGVSASQGQTFLTQVIERLLYAARQYGGEIVDVSGKQMKFHDIVYLSDGSVRPFIQTLKLLDEAFKGRSAESIGKFFDDIHLGSARGAQGLKIFLSQSSTIDELVGKFRSLSGEMNKAFDQQMQSPLKQLDKLKAQLTDIAITLGIPTVAALQSLASAFKPVLAQVQDLAAKFSQLPQPVQTGIALVLGLGSAALIGGGGLLVMIGHVVRLRADLALLQSMGVIGSLSTGIGAIAAGALVAASGIAALGAAVASLFQLQKQLDQQGKINSSQGSFGAKAATSSFNWLFNAFPFLGSGGGASTDTDKVKENSAQTGNDVAQGLLDGFRKKLEEIKAALQDAFKPGNFSFNPDTVLKQALKIEDVRQHFAQFSDQYADVVDKLSADQQQVIADGMNRVNALVTNGAKPEQAMSALRALEQDLKRFRQQVAADDKAEARKQQQEAAADSVAAFKERYLAGLKDFSNEQNELIAGGIKTLENAARNGADPKSIKDDLRLVEQAWKSINDQIGDVDKTTRMLDETQKKYEASIKRQQKEKPELPSIESRLPTALLPSFLAAKPIVEQGTKVTDAMKGLGVTSQFSLNMAADAARVLYAELQTLKPGAEDDTQAFLAMRHAVISAEEGGKALGAEFIRLRDEMEAIKKFGDTSDDIIRLTNMTVQTKILDYATNGLGMTYKSLVDTTMSGLSNVGSILVQLVTNTKSAIASLKNLLQELAGAVVGTLLKLAVSKILIKIFPDLADPNTKAVSANATATVLLTTATKTQTIAENANTEALNRLTEAINNMAGAQSGPDSTGGFLGGFLGGLFGFGIKAMGGGGGWLPGHADGGLITGNHLAMVHAGEYVINAPMTRALNGMIAGDGFGGSGGDNFTFDFRGASLGGLTPGSVEAMMRPMVSKLRRASGRSRNGKF